MTSSLIGNVQWRDWSKVPPELLELISHKVGEIGDYVRFGAVCKPCLSAASCHNLPPQTPWMLLPYHPNGTLRRFRSLPTGRIYSFDSPVFRRCVIYTSPHGWLLLSDPSLSASLFNPITKAHIHLPPLPTFPTSHSITASITGFAATSNVKNWSLMQIFFKFYTFVSDAGDLIVVLVTEDPDFLYCRVQDNAWIRPHRGCTSPIHSVMYHRGRFYIINKNKEVEACELNPEAQFTLIRSLQVPINFTWCCLVEVARELILVICPDYYKLIHKDGEMTWSKIQDIGHHTLFVAIMSCVIAGAAGDASGCRRNCVYVCGDNGASFPVQPFYVVSVEDGRVERIPHFEEDYSFGQITSSWFMPSLV